MSGHKIHNNAQDPVTPVGGIDGLGAQGVNDILAWAFSLLVDSVKVHNKSAEIHAQGLQSIADEEKKLNNQLADMKYNQIPAAQKKKEDHKTQNPWFWAGDWHRFWKHHRTEHTTNQAQINSAIDANSEVDKQRQTIEGKESVLQQSSQSGAASINTLVDAGMQANQQASNTLDMLSSITRQIASMTK